MLLKFLHLPELIKLLHLLLAFLRSFETLCLFQQVQYEFDALLRIN